MTANAESRPALALGPDLTINHAAALREQLLDAIGAGTADLCLDLSAVTDFDSSAVQCLIAARHSLATRGARLCLVAAGVPVQDALHRFGLQDLLQPEAAGTH